jgi:hypothetical protein
LIRHFRNPAANAFIQDDYKVFSNLTLNLGLRWEYNVLNADNRGQLVNVWPNLINNVPVPGTTPATGTLAGFVLPSNYEPALNPAPPVSGLFQNDRTISTAHDPPITNFAPRVGFAWKPLPTDRLVIRGGGGFFYDRIGQTVNNKSGVQSMPYAVPVFKSGTGNFASSMAQPYTPTSLGWTPRWATINTTANTGTSSNLSVISLDPNYPNPVNYQWNLNVQYEFLSKWVMEIGYVGSRGIHQALSGTNQQINGAQLASATNPINGITRNTTGNALVRVPYLGFGPAGLAQDRTIGDSKFNSFQATVRKQFSHGFQMQAAYTWSRSFSTVPYIQVNDPASPQYGLDPNYRPHRLAINYSYDLPFGNHEGFLGKITNGWNLAGVTVIQNGTPLTILDTRGGAIFGFGVGTPQTSTAQYAAGMGNTNVATTGDIHSRLGGINGGPGYFNPAAFGTLPTVGATTGVSGTGGTGWGNGGLGSVLGPGQMNYDATLQKTTKVGGIHEDANLVFRAEFFNMFNHPQFGNPTGAQLQLNGTSFGQITSTSVNPRLIQFALKYVF